MMQQSTRSKIASPHTDDRSSNPIESMHDIFSNEYRCGILYYLTEVEEPARVDDVLARIDDWCPETRDEPRDGPEATKDWFLREHVHEMEQFGLVDVDRPGERLRLPDDVSLSVTRPWNDER